MRLEIKIPLLVAGFSIAAVAVGGAISTRIARDQLRETIIENFHHSAHAYASAVSSYLDGALASIRITAASPALASYRPPDRSDPSIIGLPEDEGGPQRARADRILTLSSEFESIMLLDPSGQVVFVEPFAQQRALVSGDLTYLAWVDAAIERHGPVVSDLHISPTTFAPSVVIATPIHDDDGQVVGIWAGALDLANLTDLASSSVTDAAPTSYGIVTDARGLVIAHQANQSYVSYQTDFGAVPPVAAALDGTDGAGRWVNPIDGEAKLGAYVPLDPHGWAVVYSTPERLALAPAGEVARSIVVAGLAISAMILLLAALLIRRITRPLRLLTGAVGALERGDFEQRVLLTSRDELGQLATSFNAMAQQLGANQSELLDRADRLAKVNQELEASNQELEAFSYSVSHDLRAPLRAIDGFSMVLAEDHEAQLNDDGKAILARVRAATVRMGNLIDDLLVLSRIGRVPMRRQPVDLSAMCREVVAELATADPERQVDVVIAPDLRVDADPALLRVVLTNLIGNAWKFTGHVARPSIHIERVVGPRGRCIVVRDNGVGFDMAAAGKLFGAFERLHASSEFPGSGIGLATVRRIIRRHGGEIWAYAEPNRGASFSFTFGQNAAQRATALGNDAGEADPAQRRRILIVDDEEGVLRSLRRGLEREGFEATTARNANRALELVATTDFDAALIDVSMPDVSGLELTRRLRGQPRASSLPIVLMSGATLDAKDRAVALDAGADSFVSTPCDLHEMASTLSAAIRARSRATA